MLVLTLIFRHGFTAVWPPALSYLAFWFAFHQRVPLHDITRRLGGDYSYGIYLYAWPITSLPLAEGAA